MTSRNHTFTRSILCSAILLALAGQVQAAGFQVNEHSAAGLGRAYAGEAAVTVDPTVIAHNPAGMSMLNAPAFSIPTVHINPNIDVGKPGAGDVGQSSWVSTYKSNWIPTFYFSMPYGDRLAFGIGGFSNFALETDYDQGFDHLDEADKSEIQTYNINPAIAWKYNDQISIGAGINYVLADAKFTAEGGSLEGDDTSWGWNIGLLAQLNEAQIGLAYRSGIALELDLDANFTDETPDTTGDMDVDLPGILELAVLYPLNEQFDVHGNIQYTAWSSFDELNPKLKQPDGTTISVTEEQSWDDVWRLGAGVTWYPAQQWQVRMGAAYDQSPVDDDHRTLLIPDSDRYWLSLGGSWQVNPSLSLDAGYSHLFVDDASVEFGTTKLDVESSYNIFGLQANWVF